MYMRVWVWVCAMYVFMRLGGLPAFRFISSESTMPSYYMSLFYKCNICIYVLLHSLSPRPSLLPRLPPRPLSHKKSRRQPNPNTLMIRRLLTRMSQIHTRRFRLVRLLEYKYTYAAIHMLTSTCPRPFGDSLRPSDWSRAK